MPKNFLSVLAATIVLLIALPASAADSYKVLLDYGGANGIGASNLVYEGGVLYGTAFLRLGGGIFYELQSGADGTWTQTVLYEFPVGSAVPGPVISECNGSFYGTTGPDGYDYGEVIQLTPGSNGSWTSQVIYRFKTQQEGDEPFGRLMCDPAGNIYGTTRSGGVNGSGTVFELTPASNGEWTAKTLHSFPSNVKDGREPVAGLIMDSSGNVYGTTELGGFYSNSNCTVNGCGTVFELKPKTGGGWTETVLQSFDFKYGAAPYADLTFGTDGNLYGTTRGGGDFGNGIVFQLIPGESGRWSEKLLHSFKPNGRDGVLPTSGVTFDGDGNLYGTTSNGGAYGYGSTCGGRGCGTVFKLAPGADDLWTEQILHSFNGTDGAWPEFSDLVIDNSGDLFGTTTLGGHCGNGQGCGVSFEVLP
ncbi:MAG TPA: choice-of-anchor tandem repeat GloVer-containing protein [Terriglobales bacterium]